jgi:hypothetical protein
MNFDFYQLYKDYSNTELLKIVKRPTNHQPVAVAIATQILNERQVTTDEVQLVDQHFRDIDATEKAKKEKIDDLKGKVTDFFEPVLLPAEKVEPNKWVKILLFVIAIQYAWSLFEIAKRLTGFLQCDNCSFDITLFAEFLTLLYVPLICFLLFKRRRWGWILLFAENFFSVISRVSQSYIFFNYQSIHHGNTTSFLLPILIKSAFVFFLWRDSIANHFGINAETKKKTALITTIGSLLFISIMYLMSEL